MKDQLIFHGKPVAVSLTESAVRASSQLETTLIIEIQIYFSCLLGKRLAFYTQETMGGTWKVEPEMFRTMLESAQQLSDRIFIRFNTVMTRSCPVADYAGPPPVTDFKIINQKPYVPDWLNIDFSNGLWSGEYGWAASKRGESNTKQVRGEAVRVDRQA